MLLIKSGKHGGLGFQSMDQVILCILNYTEALWFIQPITEAKYIFQTDKY